MIRLRILVGPLCTIYRLLL